MNEIVYGIDFGTTNSAVAYMCDGKTRIVPAGTNGEQLMRSELFFPHQEKRVVVGNTAREEYLTYEMESRLIQSVKSVLPSRHFTSIWTGNQSYEAEDLVAFILETLKKAADRETGRYVTSVVQGKPAYFSRDRAAENLAVKRLRTAAEYAGFTHITFQMEPIAAAISYVMTLQSPELVLAADLGGGTSLVPLVQSAMAAIFGPEKITVSTNSFLGVVSGLAQVGSYI